MRNCNTTEQATLSTILNDCVTAAHESILFPCNLSGSPYAGVHLMRYVCSGIVSHSQACG